MGVDGQHHIPAVYPPGKTRCPLYRRLGGPQGRSGRVRKISLPPPTGIRPPDCPACSESLYRWAILVHVYPEMKDTKRLGGEGKSPLRRWQHCRVWHIPFPFDFALKKTSGRPEVSLRPRCENEVTTRLRAQAAEFCDIRIPQKKLAPRRNKCLHKVGYVEK